MFPQQRKGAGWKWHRARSSVPNSLGSACAQQISQQLRNTNAGRNYPIKMQRGEGNGKNTLKTSPVNLSGKLPLGADWVQISPVSSTKNMDFLEQCGLREW